MQSHYDVIILGDTLAGRITGTLLARSGCRVLTFEGGSPLASPWFASCVSLEKVLDQLSGRSCMTTPPAFQVLTREARVDISKKHPLDETLVREFPDDAAALGSLFGNLGRCAELIEKTCSETGGLPLKGEGGALAFRWRALRNSLRISQLKEPLPRTLERLNLGAAAASFVQTLFSGLSLQPIESLTFAEAALLWKAHAGEHGVSASGLDTLLRQRYEQFHGQSAPLDTFKHFEVSGQQIKQVILKNGSSCSADNYLLAGVNPASSLPASQVKGDITLPSPPEQVSTSTLSGKTSALLAERVLLGGESVLRLGFENGEGGKTCTLSVPRGQSMPMGEALKQALATVIPFCAYELEAPVPGREKHKSTPRRNMFGQSASVRLMRNAYWCDGSAILPSLGTPGEVLLGISLAHRISSRRPQK